MYTHSTETHTHTLCRGKSAHVGGSPCMTFSRSKVVFLWKLHPVRLRVRCWWFDLPQVCISGILTPCQGSWMLLELARRHVNKCVCVCPSCSPFYVFVTCHKFCSVHTFTPVVWFIWFRPRKKKKKINCCV